MPPKRKAKTKGKPEGEAAIITGQQALQLKEALNAGQKLDDETLLTLLKADMPCEGLYSKTCKSKGANPNCLCNLVPAPDAFRRAGLWAKNADSASALGPDPSDVRREDASKPVGLRNLGNTCYANSVLQCLFSTRPFRNAVLSSEGPLADDPAVKALKELFAQMQCGATDPVDPAPLVAALQLDHAVQQDGQEFMKLFLTLLEHKFAEAGQEELRDVIQGLFRGHAGYETVCQACQAPSDSSARSDNFYELDIPVKGFKSLHESLGSLLAPELLEGDNQYSCDRCNGKRDATRQLRVRSLPPLLCLSLQRFVFDMVKLDRVKVTDKFSFPLELKGAALSDEPDALDSVYDLEAILIHKGGSAMHGHYVAHIRLGISKDGSGGEWWRFDDESVTKMEGGPTASSGDHGVAAPAQAGAAAGKSKSESKSKGKGKKKGPAPTNADKAGIEKTAASGGRGKQSTRGRGGKTTAKGKATATAAAKGKGKGKGKGRRGKAAETSSSEEEEEIDSSDSDSEYGWPSDSEDEVAAAIKAAEANGDVVEGADDVLDNAMTPSEEVVGDAPIAAHVDSGDAQPLPAAGSKEGDNDATAPSSSSSPSMEIVSANAYLLLYRKRGADLDGTDLPPPAQEWLNAAKERLHAEFEQRAATYATAKTEAAAQLDSRRQEVRGLVESSAKMPPGDPGRFISTSWLQEWSDSTLSPGPIDNAPLLCPHGKLDPSRTTAMRRLPTHAWEQLVATCRGGPELTPADACPVCLSDHLAAVAAAEDTQEARDRFLSVAAVLEELGERGRRPPGVGVPAYYVGKSWLGAWQKRGGRSMGATPPTAPIMCPHGALAPESLTKYSKRTAIPADFWAFLQSSWNLANLEKERKARAKRADAARKADGGAAVMDNDNVNDNGGDIVMLESDNDNKTAVGEQKSNGGGGEDSAIEEIHLLDEEEEGIPEGGRGGAATTNAATRNAGTANGPAIVISNGDATGGGEELVEFPIKCKECPVCVSEMRAAAKLTSGLQNRREAERAALGHLAGSAPILTPLAPGQTYYLIPSAFMHVWRAYMAQAGAKGATAPDGVLQPPSLAASLAAMLCSCHANAPGGPLLTHAPPAVVNRRGRWVLAGADVGARDDAYELVSQPEWESFVLHYGEEGMPFGGRGFEATLLVEPGTAAVAAAALAPSAPEEPSEKEIKEEGAKEEDQGDGEAQALQPPHGESQEGAPGSGGDGLSAVDAMHAAPAVEAAPQGCGTDSEAAAAGPASGKRKSRNTTKSQKKKGLEEEEKEDDTIEAEAEGGERSEIDDEDDVDGFLKDEAPIGNDYTVQRKGAAARAAAAGRAWLDPCPAVCSTTVAAMEQADKVARLTYVEKEIMVETVPTDLEAIAATATAAADAAASLAAAGGVERKSKRARKGRYPVVIDSTTTVSDLRLRIFQALGVHPRNARIFLRGHVVEAADDDTMAQCEIFPGEEVRVVDTGEHDASDLVGLFPGGGGKKGGKESQAPEGFTGTALTGLGGLPQPQVPPQGSGDVILAD